MNPSTKIEENTAEKMTIPEVKDMKSANPTPPILPNKPKKKLNKLFFILPPVFLVVAAVLVVVSLVFVFKVFNDPLVAKWQSADSTKTGSITGIEFTKDKMVLKQEVSTEKLVLTVDYKVASKKDGTYNLEISNPALDVSGASVTEDQKAQALQAYKDSIQKDNKLTVKVSTDGKTLTLIGTDGSSVGDLQKV